MTKINSDNEKKLMELSERRIKKSQLDTRSVLGDFVKIVNPKVRDNVFDYSADPIYNAIALVCQAAKIPMIIFDEIVDKKHGEVNLEEISRIGGLYYREVILKDDWWKQDNGPLLAYFEEGNVPVALIPKNPGEYILVDVTKNEEFKVTPEIAEKLKPQAVFLYRQFPNKKLKVVDLIKFAYAATWKRDGAIAISVALVAALIGLLVPRVTQQIFDVYIPNGESSQLIQVGFLLVGFLAGKAVFDLGRSFCTLRIEGKMESGVQTAVWGRLVSLPVSFFRDYTSGDLVMRAFGIAQIRSILTGAITSTLFSSLFSVLYIYQVYKYGKELWKVSLIMVGLLMAVSYFMGKWQLKYEGDFLKVNNKTSGVVFQIINGVAKFRTAGAENRAFKQWAKLFIESRKINFRKETITTIMQTINSAMSITFSLVFYVMIVKKDIEIQTGTFIAFSTAFGSFSQAMMSIMQTYIQINCIKPLIDMCKPIIETLPEQDDSKNAAGDLEGSIRVSNVSFKYEAEGPLVLDDVSIEVKPGEYIGIVGPSGSGKSTLFRLLIGFEEPEIGQIYYDNKDLATINTKDVRKQIGVVMQNAQLMTGDIFSNIIGANTKLTITDAERAIKMAGMEEDIKMMPMGLHTAVAEGASTISGGQKQRLIIARAVAHNPKILLFDEATSALDNRTQKIVQDSLDNMNSTRIVIAHRLSTIENCDRIIVLVDGKVEEQGSYQELINNQGTFAKMAARQII